MMHSPPTAPGNVQYSDHSNNCPKKTVHDVTFALKFLHGKQMAACEQIG